MTQKTIRRSRAKPGPAEKRTPVRPATFFASMALTGICVAIIVIIAVGNIPLDRFGSWPRAFVVVLLLAFIVASLATTEVIPWKSRSWWDWRQPKVLGSVIFLLLSAVGFFVGVSNIFAPALADQATQVAIRDKVEVIKSGTGEVIAGQRRISDAMGIGHQPMIATRIKGYWGEPGCAVTYKITRTEQALRIERSKWRSTTKYRRWRFTIESEADTPPAGSMRTSTITGTEREGFDPGQTVKFVFSTDGDSEFLDWRGADPDQAKPELVRCPLES